VITPPLAIVEAQDLAFEIGVLLYEMGYLPEAIPFFECSLALHERGLLVQMFSRMGRRCCGW
jgi:hypothetical protein